MKTFLVESLLLFSKSFWFTVILFSAIGLVLLLILIFNILARQENILERENSFSIFISYILNFLNKFILIPIDSLSDALYRTFKTLKAFLPETQYKYALPWTMLIGADGSGKRSLLKSLEMYSPLDTIVSNDQSAAWYFFNKGVIVHVSGRLTLYEDENQVLTSSHMLWTRLLNLFTNHRSSIPIDNLVVTFSCEDIINDTDEELLAKAEYLFSKIWEAKQQFGLKFPVYVIFTKLDVIPGFESFCEILDDDIRQEMFGWSSSYGMHTMPTDWYEEMFDAVLERLLVLQDIVFANVSNRTEVTHNFTSRIFLFREHFLRLRYKMLLVLKQLSHSGYDTDLFIRGVYFTGEYKDKTIFGTKLFEEKVFVERGISTPIKKTRLSTNATVKLMQIASVGLIAGFGWNFYLQHTHLNVAATRQYHALLSLNLTIESIKEQKQIDEDVFNNAYNTFFYSMDVIHNVRWYLWLNPSSWISTVSKNTHKALVRACQFILLDQVQFEFNNKLEKFTHEVLGKDILVSSSNNAFNDPKSIYAKDFFRFIDLVYRFKQADLTLQEFPITVRLHDLEKMLFDIFELNVNIQSRHADIYRDAMESSHVQKIVWTKYRKHFVQAFDSKSKAFLKYLLDPQYSCQCIYELKEQLQKLSKGSGDLMSLKQNLYQAIDLLNNSIDLIGGDASKFSLGPDWDRYVKTLDSLKPMIGSQNIDEFYKEINKQFNKLKVFLLNEQLPLVGFLITSDPTGRKIVSPELLKLMGLLNTISIEGLVAAKSNASAESNGSGKDSSGPHSGQSTSDGGVKKALLGQLKQQDQDNKTIVLDIQNLNDCIDLIEKFQHLATKEMYIMKDNHMIYQATLATLVDQLDSRLFTGEAIKDQLVPEQVKASSGLIQKLLVFLFEHKTDKAVMFYAKVRNAIISLITKIALNAYSELQDKKLYQLSYESIDPAGYDPVALQDYCDTQIRHMHNIVQPIKPYLDLAQYIISLDLGVSLDTSLQYLLEVNKQLEELKAKAGDIALLNKLIKKIFSDKDVFKAIEEARWEGDGGFFAEKFSRMIKDAKVLGDKAKVEIFKKDFESLRAFFEQNLAGKFPFSDKKDAIEAVFDDVIEFYKQLDTFRKKYTDEVLKLYELPELEKHLQFIRTMTKMQLWIESLAKNVKSDLKIVCDMRTRSGAEHNFDQLSQWTISFDKQKFDFRADLVSTPYMQYHEIDQTFQLASGSKLHFSNGSTDYVLTHSGGWSLFKLIRDYGKGGGQSPDLTIKLPVVRKIEKNGKEYIEETKLIAQMKVELWQDKTNIPYEPLPVKAPE